MELNTDQRKTISFTPWFQFYLSCCSNHFQPHPFSSTVYSKGTHWFSWNFSPVLLRIRIWVKTRLFILFLWMLWSPIIISVLPVLITLAKLPLINVLCFQIWKFRYLSYVRFWFDFLVSLKIFLSRFNLQ